MSGRKSRQKGQRGEREAAKVLSTLWGMEVVRGVQFSGSPDSPDLKGLTKIGLHPEVKRDETTISNKVQRLLNERCPVIGTYKNEKYVIFKVGGGGVKTLHRLPVISVTKSIYAAINQATNDSGPDLIPFVMSRRNRQPWYFIVKLSDFDEFQKKIEETR